MKLNSMLVTIIIFTTIIIFGYGLLTSLVEMLFTGYLDRLFSWGQ